MKDKVSNAGFEKEIEFIKKHKINNIMLAGRLKICRSMFSLKLNGYKGNRFTNEQQQKITDYLHEIRLDLQNMVG